MNETYFVLFIIGVVLVSWILKSTQKEGMETCSRPLRGPKDNEYPEVYGPSGRRPVPGTSREPGEQTREGTPGQAPGEQRREGTPGQAPGEQRREGTPGQAPGEQTRAGTPGQPRTLGTVDDSKCSITGQVQKTSGGPIQPGPGLYAAWSDDDVMDSTTMTQNPLYASTFQFQIPSYKMDLSFPTEGPPQPYLTDFSKFHR